MKKNFKVAYLSPIYIFLGVVAYVLHKWLMTFIEDEESMLLPKGTAPEILIWVLTAAAIVAAFWFTRKTKLTPPERWQGAAYDLIEALGVLTLLFEKAQGPDMLVKIYRVFCVVGAVCLAACAVLRAMEKKPPFLLNLGPCVLFVLHLLIYYQLYSEVPQLMNYVLGLGAVLCLTLAGYFRLAASSGLPAKGWYHGVCLLGVYFCAAAIAQKTFGGFFAASAVWLATACGGLEKVEG